MVDQKEIDAMVERVRVRMERKLMKDLELMLTGGAGFSGPSTYPPKIEHNTNYVVLVNTLVA